MMSVLVLCYEKCSTCKKALDWLCAQGVSHTVRDIVGERPNEEELARWITESRLPVKRFFNTSGLKYKALGLKEKLADMEEADQIALLASDGMLVKRPLLVAENGVYPGFREAEWQALLSL